MRHSDSSPSIPPRFVAFARRYHPSTCGFAPSDARCCVHGLGLGEPVPAPRRSLRWRRRGLPGSRETHRAHMHADHQSQDWQRQKHRLVRIARKGPGSGEELRRRLAAACVPWAVGLKRHVQLRRERRLRQSESPTIGSHQAHGCRPPCRLATSDQLSRRDPALTQRAGLHDDTPCHRHRPPASVEVGRAYFSQPIFRPDRSLFSPAPSPRCPGRGHNRRIL